MSTTPLGRRLLIRNVFVRNFEQSISDDLQPAIDQIDMTAMHKREYGDGCVVTTFYDEERQEEFYIYRFKYDCAIRLADSSTLDDDEIKVLAELQATFVADYQSSSEITKEEVSEFGELYVGYHVWPYWREFVQSNFQKSALPVVPLPPYKVEKPLI